MTRRIRLRTVFVLVLSTVAGIAYLAQFEPALAATPESTLAPSFAQQVQPFLKQNCISCHNADLATSGVRVDGLDASLEDRHLKLWEAVRHRVSDGTMPPKGMPQPSSAEREQMVNWITKALDVARSRPTPKNGIVRRLTVAQYRNTLRELLQLDDDVTEALPPDAVSKDGFVNNTETLQLSPLLLESYLEIAEEALQRSIVDPKTKPAVQNFRVDLGAGVNPDPIPDPLVLGANSMLLENKDVLVTQLTPKKPFAFTPVSMRSKYRFIEGYEGNDTVRGWREYDSIYHSVFADMRGSRGYPKGMAYGTVPQGLLLRPAIPNDETFTADGTYGPKANFKISLRELPDNGRFRVIVTAAKYNDGLLLDAKDTPQAEGAGSIVVRDWKTAKSVTIPQAGIYQVDVYQGAKSPGRPAADSSRLGEGLGGSWTFEGGGPVRLENKAHLADSPFGKAVSLDGKEDSVSIPQSEGMNVGSGDFTVAAWIHPKRGRQTALVGRGGHGSIPGWYLDLPAENNGALRLQTTGPDGKSNGTITSPGRLIRPNEWQHIAAVVRRGKETRLYVNGQPVAKGEIGAANLDNPKRDLQLGGLEGAQNLMGDIDEVRLYRRALGEAEVEALVEPGRKFVKPLPERPLQVMLTLGDREFSDTWRQPAFLAVRLPAGALPLRLEHTGMTDLDRIVLTPLATGHAVAGRLLAFENRSPRIGVHLGLRRDCGSTLAPVGLPQTVASGKLTRYVFEGAIRNFPSPEVEKDNVNYLAGLREIGVRSEYTDGRDMPRLLIRSVEFEGPLYETWPPVSHRKIFIDSPNKGETPAYAREVIRGFATRAYRRPVTTAEESALAAVFEKSRNEGRSFQESVKDALQVALTSPQFLFLTERSSTPTAEPVDDYELASKLSYFLWNGPPDAATLQLARRKALRGSLDAEVDRMIADPRSGQFIREFVSQWLNLEKFQVLEPDRILFPKLSSAVRRQLQQEPVQFVQHLIQNNLPVRNLISSDFVVANEVVASYYDLGEKTESGFQFVAIPHGRPELGGVLTQAAIMAGLSDGRESNPVKRGAWLARKIVAEPPDDPPANVPALKESTAKLTLRERLEQHRNQPGCVQCHTKIDPWGIPFEEFDAGGRLKQKQVDARSTLPDKHEVAGTADLKRYLSEDRIDQVAFSVLKHLATYATGRNLTFNEVNHLKQDGQRLKAGGYRMKDMIHYVANSKFFLEK